MKESAPAAAREGPKLLAPALWLAAALLVLIAIATTCGRTGTLDLGDVLQGLVAIFGFGDGLAPTDQARVELRLFEALATAGVGAALAFAGVLLQGVFRNGLAAPSIIGVSSGASVGAAFAVLVVGGYAPHFIREATQNSTPFLMMAASFVGALVATGTVMVIASRHGRISVPTLLLAGIAVNACCGGLLAAIQAISMRDFEIARAIFAWTFGSLEDKSLGDAALIWLSVLIGSLTVPFLADELDLLGGGEDDAAALGVRLNLVKGLAVGAAALTASTAVSVAGQIAFVGLVVPHLLRLILGASHRRLLPLSILGGAIFLLGAQVLQIAVLGDSALRPGVLMSLLGGPFFIALLLRQSKELQSWR